MKDSGEQEFRTANEMLGQLRLMRASVRRWGIATVGGMVFLILLVWAFAFFRPMKPIEFWLFTIVLSLSSIAEVMLTRWQSRSFTSLSDEIRSAMQDRLLVSGRICKTGSRTASGKAVSPQRDPTALNCLRILSIFRWFLDQETQKLVGLTLDDLNRDRKEMLREKLSPSFIRLCLSWRVLRSAVPILWAGLTSVLKQIAGVSKTIRQIMGKK